MNARHIPLDVTNQQTLDAAFKNIEGEFGSLDVLINNAGISKYDGVSPSQLEMSELKETFETNFFGMFAVTRTLLPFLRERPNGRIVNLSSDLGSITINSAPKSEWSRFNLLPITAPKQPLMP